MLSHRMSLISLQKKKKKIEDIILEKYREEDRTLKSSQRWDNVTKYIYYIYMRSKGCQRGRPLFHKLSPLLYN